MTSPGRLLPVLTALIACESPVAPGAPESVPVGRGPVASATPTLGPNLAPNPSFESGAAGAPQGWAPNPNTVPATFEWAESFGRTESASVRIVTTNGGLSAFATPGWRTPGAIPLQTGSTYRASVWTYTSDGGVGHVPAIQFFRADGTFLGAIGATHPSGLTDPDGTWVYKEFDFDISAFPGLADATHVRLIVVQDIFETVGTQTSVYFDDVYFGEILPGALVVDVDAKPGSDANHINCSNGREVIPVAILTTPDFDATTVDHRTVTFAGASETHVNRRTGESRRHVEDVDRDGDPDLLLHFRYGDTSLTCDSTEGRLSGYTYEGLPVEGSDALLVSARGRAPGD